MSEVSSQPPRPASTDPGHSTTNGNSPRDGHDMDITEMEARATSLDSPNDTPKKRGIVRSQTMPPGSRTYGASGPIARATSPGQQGDVNVRLESVKSWSVNTYKYTKQIIDEKLGRASRTVNLELEGQIEVLRDTQSRYRVMLEATRRMTKHLRSVVAGQHTLGSMFKDLGGRQPELGEEFAYNAEAQLVLERNGEHLLAALDYFLQTLDTLCNRTMEDTLFTVRSYETARVEFDAYRRDAEVAAAAISRDPLGATKAQEAQQKYERHRTKYERLRGDVEVKMKFLEENKVRVMQKQLLLFHNAISAYFSGNQAALDATMKQFSIKVKSGNNTPPSWLEQHPTQ